MQISKRNKPSRPQVPTASTSQSPDTELNIENKNTSNMKKKLKKEYKANERLTLKVDPPDLDLVKLLSTLEDKKNYEMTKEIIQFYMNNKLEDRERRIIENMFNQKYEK